MKTIQLVISTLLLCLIATASFGQELKPLAREVQKRHQEKATFVNIENLLQAQQNSQLSTLVEKDARNAQLFSYKSTLAAEIITNRYEALTFDMELDGAIKTIEVVLVKQSFNDYILKSSSGTLPETIANRGAHYRGVVLGEENSSLVAISIFHGELVGVISTQDKGDFNMGKLMDHDYHVVYNDNDLIRTPTFNCLSDDANLDDRSRESINQAKSNNPADYCINVYLEADYEIYQNEGSSVANTEAFVTGLFNQTAAIYQNESVTVQISEIFVWDTPDSYSNTSISTARNQFVSARPTFNGDLAQLLEYSSSGGGGIAYGIGGLCGGTSSPGPYAATTLFPSFAVVPTYSRQVKVLTHEMGHNLGSRHTHACVWNGNNTTLDDYGNYYSNGTFQNGSEGGSCVDQNNPKLSVTPTIMSYYDSRNFGTFPMSNGFGTQPGDLIRAEIVAATCFSLCNPSTDCGTTISSFPYSESFESNFGAWQQSAADDFNWSRNSGGTPSTQTGPTSAADGSTYAYMESSSPNYPSKTAILNSPCFDLSGQSGANLSFAYHMYGASMGTLNLQVSTNNGTSWSTIWSQSGDQGNQWFTANVDLSSYSGNTIQLRFFGTTSASYRSDMSIDDISISAGSSCNTITSFPYTESFESSFGAWEQSNTDDFNWTRNSGGTPSTSTGPTSAAAGTFYAYVESSSPNHPNKTTILNSPCFDLSGQSGTSMSFAYHMYGSSMGTLNLQISTNGGSSWTSVWSLSGDQGNQWSTANVDLSAYSGSVIQLRYVGTTANSYRSDMSVDDITISESASCSAGTTISSFPYTESFESSFGAWEQATGDDFNWTRNSGTTPSTSTGPSSAASGSFYAYTESSFENHPNKVAILNSPCFNLSGQSGTNLSFSYHMYGSSMGTLQLQVSTNGGNSWSTLWSLTGDQGNQWSTANVNLNAYSGGTIQLRYVGTTATSYRSDMAIDNFSITSSGGNDNDIVSGNALEGIDSDVLLYPNPADDFVNISLQDLESDEAQVYILDMLGKEVYSAESINGNDSDLRISTSSFSPGTYMVIVKDSMGNTYNKRLVIQ